jgi:hypothetical protein
LTFWAPGEVGWPRESARPVRPTLQGCAPTELEEAQATYDEALRRVISDLTATTDLQPEIVVDFTDPGGLQYLYQAGDGSSHPSSLDGEVDEEAATLSGRPRKFVDAGGSGTGVVSLVE